MVGRRALLWWVRLSNPSSYHKPLGTGVASSFSTISIHCPNPNNPGTGETFLKTQEVGLQRVLRRWFNCSGCLCVQQQRRIGRKAFGHQQPQQDILTPGRRHLRKGEAAPENTRRTEVITIYEKLTKGREKDEDFIFRPASNILEMFGANKGLGGVEPVGGIDSPISPNDSAKVLDFNKFRNIVRKNYSLFSASTGLLQSHTLDSLQQGTDLRQLKNYCLSIVNPTEKDLTFLGSKLQVHELTIRDIREPNTEEKVEVFKHYTFVSLKPYLDTLSPPTVVSDEASSIDKKQVVRDRGVDLNILLFSNFAIILHYGQQWNGFKDMLGFLNLLSSYGNTELTPDWVLFSVMIELVQDAKFSVKQLEPRILSVNITEYEGDMTQLSSILTANFDNEFEIYRINSFVQPKLRVLKELRGKCSSRVRVAVLNLMSGTRKELEELVETLRHYSHILERTQDTCLTLANVKQSQESNMMGHSMKRISEVALLFLPLQAVAGFLGMNVKIPYQEWENTMPFWTIIMSSSILVILLYRVSKYASASRSATQLFKSAKSKSKI